MPGPHDKSQASHANGMRTGCEVPRMCFPESGHDAQLRRGRILFIWVVRQLLMPATKRPSKDNWKSVHASIGRIGAPQWSLEASMGRRLLNQAGCAWFSERSCYTWAASCTPRSSVAASIFRILSGDLPDRTHARHQIHIHSEALSCYSKGAPRLPKGWIPALPGTRISSTTSSRCAWL